MEASDRIGRTYFYPSASPRVSGSPALHEEMLVFGTRRVGRTFNMQGLAYAVSCRGTIAREFVADEITSEGFPAPCSAAKQRPLSWLIPVPTSYGRKLKKEAKKRARREQKQEAKRKSRWNRYAVWMLPENLVSRPVRRSSRPVAASESSYLSVFKSR